MFLVPICAPVYNHSQLPSQNNKKNQPIFQMLYIFYLKLLLFSFSFYILPKKKLLTKLITNYREINIKFFSISHFIHALPYTTTTTNFFRKF